MNLVQMNVGTKTSSKHVTQQSLNVDNMFKELLNYLLPHQGTLNATPPPPTRSTVSSSREGQP